MSGGLNTYLVVALGALHGTAPAVANMALTALLAMNAVGVLAGGVLAGRTNHHAVVAASRPRGRRHCHGARRLVRFAVRRADAAHGLQRLLRRHDLSVARHAGARRDAAGAYGRVFGFVSIGFNIGASIAPIIYGMLMDHGEPRAVFMLSAAVSIICISTVTFGFSRREVH